MTEFEYIAKKELYDTYTTKTARQKMYKEVADTMSWAFSAAANDCFKFKLVTYIATQNPEIAMIQRERRISETYGGICKLYSQGKIDNSIFDNISEFIPKSYAFKEYHIYSEILANYDTPVYLKTIIAKELLRNGRI